MNGPDRRLFLLLLAFAALFTIGTCGWGHLYNETDGQYAGAARMMAEGGSWLVPENNGIPRLVKPPLLYWNMATAMRTFGVNEFAARLPNALAIIGWVAITFLIGHRWGGAWRGFLAGGILLGCLGTFTLGRIVMPEPLFSMFIAAAVCCALYGCRSSAHQRKWFFGFWICAALASFTKGWHGAVYPLTIVGFAAVIAPSSRPALRKILTWTGPLAFFLINGIWYAAIESRFPGWLHNLIFTEQIGHVIGSSSPATSYTSVPQMQFLLLHLAWFFPWSIVLITCLQNRAGALRPLLSRTASLPLALVFSWLVVVTTSVLLAGQRQDYYAMPMWPAFALVAAAMMEGRSLRAGSWLVAALLGIGFVFAVFLPQFLGANDTATVADRTTAWTTLTQFDTHVWRSLRTTAMVALGGGMVCALAGGLLRKRATFFALLAASGFLALGAVNGTAIVSPYFSLAQIAPVLARETSENTRLVYDGNIDTASSLLFYTDLPVTLLDQKPDEDFIVRTYSIGRNRYIDSDSLTALWNSDAEVFFITETAKLSEWAQRLGTRLSPTARCGTQVVLKNSR